MEMLHRRSTDLDSLHYALHEFQLYSLSPACQFAPLERKQFRLQWTPRAQLSRFHGFSGKWRNCPTRAPHPRPIPPQRGETTTQKKQPFSY